MDKIVKINFSKGIYGSSDPRVLGDGYSAVLHNCDLTSGLVRPMRAPVAESSVPSNTIWLFHFQGTWYPTTEIRDWAAEKVGSMVRIYYMVPGGTTKPQKIIDGTAAPLGTPAPSEAPTVKAFEGGDAQIVNLTAVAEVPGPTNGGVSYGSGYYTIEKSGLYRYRVVARDAAGKAISISPEVKVQLSSVNTHQIHLKWNAITNAIYYEVYGRGGTADANAALGQMKITTNLELVDYNLSFNVPDAGLTFGSVSGTSDAEDKTEYTYIFTYLRNVNGHTDESGPSPTSERTQGASGRVITFGSVPFTPDPSLTFSGPTSAPSAGYTTLTITSLLPSQGRTTLCTSTDHGLSDGDMIGFTSTYAGDTAINNKTFRVTVPSALGKPYGFNVVKKSSGSGTIPTGSHSYRLCKVRGWDTTGPVSGLPVPALGPGSDTVTLSITLGETIDIVWDKDDGADAWVLFQDGTPVQAWSRGAVMQPGYVPGYSGTSNVGGLAIPSSDETATKAFIISEQIPSMGGRANMTEMPAGKKGSGTDVTLPSNHNIAVGQKRTVKHTGFTNASMNGTFVATMLSANSYRVQVFSTGADTGTQAVFSLGTSGSGSADDMSNVTHRRLYRTGDVNEFLLVDEIPIDQAEYTDNVDTLDLGDKIESYFETDDGATVIYAPPPADAEKCVLSGGMMFYISGNQVRWTPVNRPDAHPAVYSVTMASKPRSLVASAGSVIILCSDSIWRLEVSSPTSVYLQKTPSEQGCVAPYSVQNTPWGIIFLSPIGLMVFDAGRNMARPLFPNRLGRRFFLAPSVATTPFPHWLFPSNRTFHYAFLTRDLPGQARAGLVAQLDGQPSFPDPFAAVRSMYTNGKYYIYYAGDSTWGSHTMLKVDLETDPPTASTIGLRPLASFVTETGNPFVLLPGVSGTDGTATLQSAIDLEGTAADSDGSLAGATRSDSAPKLFRFLDDSGLKTKPGIRTGPLYDTLHERVQWKKVAFHGKGKGSCVIWVDGWRIPETGWATFQAAENPTRAREILLPRGTMGYSIDIEIASDMDPLVAVEITYSNANSQN